MVAKPSLHLVFHGNLKTLLPPRKRMATSVDYLLTRRASIKDIIESLRIPHSEIGHIMRQGEELSFSTIPATHERIDIHPIRAPFDVRIPTRLRPEPFDDVRFLVDINVGKLTSLLRMAGFDTASTAGLSSQEIAEKAIREQRILLSRNRDLLKLRAIVFAHLVRTQQPLKQLSEVLHLYGLTQDVHPFSRCLRCNILLEPVNKAEIMARLEPLTKQYYDRFYRCSACDRIYWRGSHHEHMLEVITAAVSTQEPQAN